MGRGCTFVAAEAKQKLTFVVIDALIDAACLIWPRRGSMSACLAPASGHA
jgi:hypothetical protein